MRRADLPGGAGGRSLALGNELPKSRAPSRPAVPRRRVVTRGSGWCRGMEPHAAIDHRGGDLFQRLPGYRSSLLDQRDGFRDRAIGLLRDHPDRLIHAVAVRPLRTIGHAISLKPRRPRCQRTFKLLPAAAACHRSNEAFHSQKRWSQPAATSCAATRRTNRTVDYRGGDLVQRGGTTSGSANRRAPPRPWHLRWPVPDATLPKRGLFMEGCRSHGPPMAPTGLAGRDASGRRSREERV